MSAYQVHPDTIDYIVSAAQLWRVTFYLRTTDPDVKELRETGRKDICQLYEGQPLSCVTFTDEAGAILTHQNARSVAARYREPVSPAAASYTFSRVNAPDISPVAVLKSIHCLIYQSCETDDWEETQAKRLLASIESAAIDRIAGYSDAQWGWTRDEDQERKAAIKARIKADVATA